MSNQPTNPIFNANKLKLGTFCTNTVPYMTFIPDRRDPTWEGCVAGACIADEAGLEAIVPIARWKGYLDDRPDHYSNVVFDVFTWAAGIAQATKYSAVFATSHAPNMHPVLVAKQCATIDAISGGRCALNVVGGWNRREFDMFGIDLMEHDQRYAYLDEWLHLLRRLWTDPGEFDYQSKFFRMKKAISRPHPIQRAGIPIMNAAQSPAGIRFSAKNSDIGLISLRGDTPEQWKPQIENYKRMAREEFGRELQLWTNASVVQGDTQKDADDYVRRYTEEYVDKECIDSIMDTISRENNVPPDSPQLAFMRKRMSMGAGHPLVGTSQSIAEELVRISNAGIDGIIFTWVDHIDGVERFVRGVVPLLEQSGLRKPHKKPS